MDLNSRQYIRSKLIADVQVTPEGGEPLDAMIVDLSLHGMLVQVEKMPPLGQKCHILMLLGNSPSKFPINACGKVVRVQEHCFAIEFDTVGLGEHEELESSILTHSENPKECMKEFALSSFFFDPLTASSMEPYPNKSRKRISAS